ncbi:hypothetical protein BU17DRAFT_60074 [Hysterangium stoloniferum]|nr:hypothetical protein BU17DRAFT_60074 [Hysterangium stoloniferum]
MAATGAALNIGRDGAFERERPELSQAIQDEKSCWVQIPESCHSLREDRLEPIGFPRAYNTSLKPGSDTHAQIIMLVHTMAQTSLHYIHRDCSSTSKQMKAGSDSGTISLFRHREFFVDSSDEGFEHGGFDGFLEYGQWRRGRTRGSSSMALVPWAHQHFDEGRDTGGVRREMAARDMGSSSVQEQARVRKDQEWYVRKAGSGRQARKNYKSMTDLRMIRLVKK